MTAEFSFIYLSIRDIRLFDDQHCTTVQLEPDYIKIMGSSPHKRKSLTHVLRQSERVKTLVKESAEELTSVNEGIKEELTNHGPMPGVENALEKSEAVESKVHEASHGLSVVNLALKDEVKDRNVLEAELAALKEQGQIDHHASLHDLLTGLPNRALFYDRLEHGSWQATRHGWKLAVMFVDLDDFKLINDTYGHDAGDGVLQSTARRLNGKHSWRGYGEPLRRR